MAATPYLGIRVITPFRGMLRARDELLSELIGSLNSTSASPAGRVHSARIS